MPTDLTLKDLLAAVGAGVLILNFLRLLLELIPKFGSLKDSGYSFISKRLRHKALEKRAIASNIEKVVNESVADLQKELPQGWVSRARIQWVQNETPEDLEDGDLILRIRPLEDQDKNLMNGIFYYFRKAMFPGVREVIPVTPRRAAILQLSRRTITKHHPYATAEFEREFLEPAIQAEEEISYYIDNYDRMDSRGYFTGVYLREITALAERIRYSAQRSGFGQELREITDQISSFIREYPRAPDDLWYRKGETSRYAFLLVARPAVLRKVDAYIKRAVEHIENDIEKLYVLGANQEKSFVRSVLRAIPRETTYELIELIEVYKDYRGESGGICAIFEHEPSIATAEKDINDFFE